LENFLEFSAIQIELASPEYIRERSYGEVKKPETINYRTFKPETGSLFCERIFGPTKDWECYCGKYKTIKYQGIKCEKCGVEVTHSKVRRERMGHIELVTPVSHIWFYKGTPSPIAVLLNLRMDALDDVLYYKRYIVTESKKPDKTEIEERQVLTEEEYRDCLEKFGDLFEADMGAAAIKKLLQKINLKELYEELREKFTKTKSKQEKKKLAVRLDLIGSFLASDNRPEWMILDVIPVIPPDLRPMVQLEGGRFATSDINDLYRRIINRNNRLKRLIELNAPDIIIRNEKRMLQEAVDALFDNGRRGKPVTGAGGRPLKSLADMLKGKQGRFRQNLLGKRVDYSGRSVIVIGPDLRMNQCGLPKIMALELFKPFIMNKLVEKKIVNNINGAKKLVDKASPEVWDVLDEVIQNHPVLLNRAPTLHRLGIQAFEPILIEGKAIRLHPLVCTAFNADFDGDQMAVHIPLSKLAQIEAKMLMLSTNNILSPANGRPLVTPTQDIILGLYYLTREIPVQEKPKKYYANAAEVILAYNENKVDIHQNIIVKIKKKNEEKRIETTVGRVLLNDVIPEEIEFINEEISKRNIERIVDDCYRKYGAYITIKFLDSIKMIGFKAATKLGCSIGIGDLKVSKAKYEIINKTEKEVEKIKDQRMKGYITEEEMYNKVIDLWQRAVDEISILIRNDLKEREQGNNPIALMVFSGARGSDQQVRQLIGMRGLMAKPSGEIIELPIKASFKEGLTVLEYFISTHGARKGLADTALKTATAGYLTRRLVDVAQDVVIRTEDCGTMNGVSIKALKEGENVIVPFIDRIIGRVTLDDVIHPITGEIIIEANQEITEEIADKIVKAGFEKLKIRTVLTCEAKEGICAKCYGRNLATGKIVKVGEAVGIIAAQSIGEPGTQLTMRTFHYGGIASAGGIKDTRLPYPVLIQEIPKKVVKLNDEIISLRQANIIVRRVLKDMVIPKEYKIIIPDNMWVNKGDKIAKSGEKYINAPATGIIKSKLEENKMGSKIYILGDEQEIQLKVGAKIKVEEGDILEPNTLIAEFDTYNNLIITENTGIVKFVDIVIDRTLKEEHDEITGMIIKKIVEDKERKLHPRILVTGKTVMEYDIPYGAYLVINENAEVQAGETLAKIPSELSKTKDITGGLPKVEELFEARIKKRERAIVTEIDGIVKILKREGNENVRRIKVIPIDKQGKIGKETDAKEYKVPFGRYLLVHDGDEVKAGDPLIEGTINPHDVLKIKGEIELAEFMIKNIQEVYRHQGVKINDKHFEIIIRQMLKKVKIEDSGDTPYQLNSLVNKMELMEYNLKMVEERKKPAKFSPVLLGITKASIGTESFISAASFQDTRKVLTAASIQGKKDELKGLKENVIIGHLITAGTGLKIYREQIHTVDDIVKKVNNLLLDLEEGKEEQQLAKSVRDFLEKKVSQNE